VPHPHRFLLFEFLEPGFEIVQRALGLGKEDVVQRARPAHGAAVFAVQALEVSADGGEPDGETYDRVVRLAAKSGFGGCAHGFLRDERAGELRALEHNPHQAAARALQACGFEPARGEPARLSDRADSLRK